ncbi:MAG: hypothetical protein JWM11_6310 [Planctomycetaceae bacterium]|nr:hypothetical protein [Planctomycetaceae bacterium]
MRVRIMDNSWQMVLAIVCVAGAALQLGFRIWKHWNNAQAPSSCGGGGCKSCPTAAQGEPRQLIQLELKRTGNR